MFYVIRRIFTCWVLLGLSGVAPVVAAPPVGDFFRNPEFSSFELSPDGSKLVMIGPWEGVMNLAVVDLETRVPEFLTDSRTDVISARWLNDERIHYSVAIRERGILSGMNIDASFVVNADGSDPDVFTGGAIVETLPTDPDHVLTLDFSRRRFAPDVYKVNIHNQTKEIYWRNFENLYRVRFTDEGVPMFGYKLDEEFFLSYYYYDAEADEWKRVSGPGEGHLIDIPLGWLGEDLIVSSNRGRDKRALFRFDITTMTRAERPFAADATYDLPRIDDLPSGPGVPSGSLFHLQTGDWVGYLKDGAKPEAVYLEPSHRDIQAMIDQALPQAYNRIVSADDELKRAIVRSVSDTRPPLHFLMDLKTMKLESLGDPKPWLAETVLAEQRPISFQARDGATIHGYLWLPESWEEGDTAPGLVVNPHGGPWARDSWGIRWWLNFEPQFYVSRGFAFLQVNFRGSTGYGKRHLEGLFKNLSMSHYDIMDGVQWAINEGYADPDLIGIAGASYGGYAVMMALVEEPQVFDFGINIFGVVDYEDEVERARRGQDTVFNLFLRRYGDPNDPEDQAHFRRWSPIHYIDKLQAPVFVYHGLYDQNVDIDETRDLIRELERYDKEFVRVIRTDEAHGATDERNRIDLYEQIDRFIQPFVRR